MRKAAIGIIPRYEQGCTVRAVSAALAGLAPAAGQLWEAAGGHCPCQGTSAQCHRATALSSDRVFLPDSSVPAITITVPKNC